MAKMIDKTPDYYGESLVWQSLNNNLPNNVIVYNTREINGREFDFCVVLPNKGILIIEVKGWKAEQVNLESKDTIYISGYADPVGSPKQQARVYRFALLNKIKKRYSISPLVFDMVCYPFITKDDYYKKNLNLVSEEEYTIFSEDLLEHESLNRKINLAYSSFNHVGYNDLNEDLVNKIRLLFEPEDAIKTENGSLPYSKLLLRKHELDENLISQIVEEYLSGVKYILFLKSESSFVSIARAIEASFKELYIKANNDNLSLGKQKICCRILNISRVYLRGIISHPACLFKARAIALFTEFPNKEVLLILNLSYNVGFARLYS